MKRLEKILRALTEQLERSVRRYERRHMYPWHDGVARFQDPTYGKIDRDIQWRVNDCLPVTLGQRTVWETNLQQIRDQ